MDQTAALSARTASFAPFAILVLGLASGSLMLSGGGDWIASLAQPPAPAAEAAGAVQPAPPFYLHAASPAERERAVRCLTDAIYYEAAREPEEGQRAVAQVVLNRVRDPNFPKSVCGVVYEGWQRKTGCQFSFVCDGSLRRWPVERALWDRLRPLAEQALDGYVTPEVGAATHYYADYVHPYWAPTVAEVTQIGAHIFCRWRGRAGQVSALTGRYQGGEFAISDAALEGQGAAPSQRAHATLRGRVSARLRVAMAGHGAWRA